MHQQGVYFLSVLAKRNTLSDTNLKEVYQNVDVC